MNIQPVLLDLKFLLRELCQSKALNADQYSACLVLSGIRENNRAIGFVQEGSFRIPEDQSELLPSTLTTLRSRALFCADMMLRAFGSTQDVVALRVSNPYESTICQSVCYTVSCTVDMNASSALAAALALMRNPDALTTEVLRAINVHPYIPELLTACVTKTGLHFPAFEGAPA